MDRSQKIMSIVAGVIVLAVVIVVAVVWYRNPQGAAPVGGVPSGGSGTTGGSPLATSTTRAPAPANIVVPSLGATGTPAGVAVPAAQGAGDLTGNVSYRSFNINIQNSAFSPNTVIVKLGDTVNLELTAVDANYAFTQPDYGFNTPIAKGKTKQIQFQASQAGNFEFYCGSCGGPSKGPVGHIIVAQAQ